LCVAGRGPLDDIAALILAQILGKHDLSARPLTFMEASREQIGELDVRGVLMVCVCYLEINGNPSHLRYLMRRLRDRLPGVPMAVCFWTPTKDEMSQERPDADHLVGTLRQTVACCRDTAEAGGIADKTMLAAAFG
ncbi:MAG: AI-2E family transporter, partial [Janthinobacterium lividum]